jgi:hypothetical protein
MKTIPAENRAETVLEIAGVPAARLAGLEASDMDVAMIRDAMRRMTRAEERADALLQEIAGIACAEHVRASEGKRRGADTLMSLTARYREECETIGRAAEMIDALGRMLAERLEA